MRSGRWGKEKDHAVLADAVGQGQSESKISQGVENVTKQLQKEGHTVTQKGKRAFVDGYADTLWKK
jgi:hypothetical protein